MGWSRWALSCQVRFSLLWFGLLRFAPDLSILAVLCWLQQLASRLVWSHLVFLVCSVCELCRVCSALSWLGSGLAWLVWNTLLLSGEQVWLWSGGSCLVVSVFACRILKFGVVWSVRHSPELKQLSI